MNRRELFTAAMGLPLLGISGPTVEARFQSTSQVLLDVMVTRDGGLNLDEPLHDAQVLLLTNDEDRWLLQYGETGEDGITRILSRPGTFRLEVREWDHSRVKFHHTVLLHSETVELTKDRQITVRLPK